MSIHPETLKQRRIKKGWSQQQLADHCARTKGAQVSKRTISRIESGETAPENIRRHTAESLAKALGVEPEDLAVAIDDEVGDGAGERRHAIRASVNGGVALAYDLAQHRYGVSETYLVEIAPLLFHILAEQSLAERKRRLAELEALDARLRELAPDHVEIAGNRVSFEVERRSIAAFDVFGQFDVDDEDDPEVGAHTSCKEVERVFSDFLEAQARRFAGDHEGSFDVGRYGFMNYDILGELYRNLIGDGWGPGPAELLESIDAIEAGDFASVRRFVESMQFANVRTAIESGQVRLRDMPDRLLWGDDLDARRAWVVESLPAETRRSALRSCRDMFDPEIPPAKFPSMNEADFRRLQAALEPAFRTLAAETSE